MLGPDLLRGDEAFVAVRRRHADVDDRSVRSGKPNVPEEPIRVLRLRDHLDTRVVEQPDDPFAGEHHVVRDDYSHGIFARRLCGSTSSEPPSAPTRSAMGRSADAPAVPSSLTWTTSCSSSRATSTETNVASRPTASPIA